MYPFIVGLMSCAFVGKVFLCVCVCLCVCSVENHAVVQEDSCGSAHTVVVNRNGEYCPSLEQTGRLGKENSAQWRIQHAPLSSHGKCLS